MKTKVIDGVKYEVVDWVDGFMCNDDNLLILRPLPKPRKTLVSIVAESLGWTEGYFRAMHKVLSVAFDAIEERLAALEEAAKK